MEVSEEEQKIRAELEREIERGLEEELKDAICRLSLDLHRLHLQKESKPRRLQQMVDTRQVTTLVKITTRTAGGCLMQVCETKTDALDGVTQPTPRAATPGAPGTKKKKTTTTRSPGGGTGGGSYTSTQTKKRLELGWKY